MYRLADIVVVKQSDTELAVYEFRIECNLMTYVIKFNRKYQICKFASATFFISDEMVYTFSEASQKFGIGGKPSGGNAPWEAQGGHCPFALFSLRHHCI